MSLSIDHFIIINQEASNDLFLSLYLFLVIYKIRQIINVVFSCCVFLHAVHLIKQFVCVLSPNSTESNTTPLSIQLHTIHIQHIMYLPSHNAMYIYSKLP